MKKSLAIVPFLLFLVSCGHIDRELAQLTGDASSICQNGVLYYQFSSGAAVAYNTNGTIKLCK